MKLITALLTLLLFTISADRTLAAESDFIIENGILLSYNGNDAEVILPGTVISIGNCAFVGKEMRSVILPDTVTSIGIGAFSQCKNLSEITFSDSVIEIGAYAFEGTPWLMERQNENPLVIVNNG